MRKAARIDGNHREIRDAFRWCGYVWEDTFRLGEGFPDALVVTKSGTIVLLEIKMPGEGLTPKERAFHERFKGPLAIVYGVEDAFAKVTKWD